MSSAGFDPALKALVEVAPASWLPLANRPAATARVIDADVATVSGAADKVIRVDATNPYLLHLEFVAGHDGAELPPRAMMRNAVLHARHSLPVRTLVVVLHREADSPRLNGLSRVHLDRQEEQEDQQKEQEEEKDGAKKEEAAAGKREDEPELTFCFGVLRVWLVPPEQFLKAGLAAVPLAPVAAVTEEELPGIIEQMKKRLARRDARKLAGDLWTATALLMGLRYDEELVAELLREVHMLEESTTYQAILAEGARKEARKMLILFATPTLGAPDKQARQALDAIKDLEGLEALAGRVSSSKSWGELLGLPASPPPPRPKRRKT